MHSNIYQCSQKKKLHNPTILNRSPRVHTCQALRLSSSKMLRRLFFSQAESPRPKSRFAEQLSVFNNADTVATIIDNITDLPTLCNLACVFPFVGLVFAQYPRSILAHTVSTNQSLAFVASTEYWTQGENPAALSFMETIDRGYPHTPRIFNGSQTLQKLLIIDDAIEKFSGFLQITQEGVEVKTVQDYKIDIKPGLFSYLSSLIMPPYYSIRREKDSSPDRAKEALWHLEIYSALFLTGGRTAYRSSPECLADQASYLHRLDSCVLWTLSSICTHFRQTLNSPTLHDTQHKLYEILKLGHGLRMSGRQPYLRFLESKDFCEKHLAYQLSLALPEMLRVFHHQWSDYLPRQVPNVPYHSTDHRSPRGVFQQRREAWTLLWGFYIHEELDEREEYEFVSEGFEPPKFARWWMIVEGVALGFLFWFVHKILKPIIGR